MMLLLDEVFYKCQFGPADGLLSFSILLAVCLLLLSAAEGGVEVWSCSSVFFSGRAGPCRCAGFSLAAASRGCSAVRCAGLLSQWLLLLRSNEAQGH